MIVSSYLDHYVALPGRVRPKRFPNNIEYSFKRGRGTLHLGNGFHVKNMFVADFLFLT